MDEAMASSQRPDIQSELTELRRPIRSAALAAVRARFEMAVKSPAPFAERLVHFWSNHFAVSVDNLQMNVLAGPYEFEAIRPNIFGTFTDLLLAAEMHPAMLTYLNQAQSIGPNSRLAQRRRRNNRAQGLNENLAREILELHTLGVRSGYTQHDVVELAKALTGHGVVGPNARNQQGMAQGNYVFRPAAHEPGTRTVLGNSYPEGARQAEMILRDLANHEATARHIAIKLARHFITDEPPPEVVEHLAGVFLESGGALPPLYEALLASPEYQSPANRKFLDPWDWSIAVARTIGAENIPTGQQLHNLFVQLGQPVWRPGSPAGFGSEQSAWLGPDTLLRRVEVTSALLRMAGELPDARERADSLIGDRLSNDTRQTIARADSARQAMSLFVLSPEFLFQ